MAISLLSQASDAVKAYYNNKAQEDRSRHQTEMQAHKLKQTEVKQEEQTEVKQELPEVKPGVRYWPIKIVR